MVEGLRKPTESMVMVVTVRARTVKGCIKPSSNRDG